MRALLPGECNGIILYRTINFLSFMFDDNNSIYFDKGQANQKDKASNHTRSHSLTHSLLRLTS